MNFGITASSYVGTGGNGGNSAYANEVLADNPLLYWRLGEASGTVAADSSGNGRNGTYVNSPILGYRGLVQGDGDTSTYFSNGSGAHVTLASNSWMNVTSMTVTCIVRVSLSSIRMFVSRYHDATGDRSWFLDTDSGVFKFYVRDTGGGETVVNSGFQGLVGVDYFVAAYASSSGTGIRIYDANGLVASATGAGRTVNSSSRPFMVARSDDGASYQNDTCVDDVAFYGSVLSTARLNALAAAAMTPQPQWINRASGASPRNGTTTHTITFPATTAGSFMVAVLNAADTFTIATAGWTNRLSPVGGAQLTLCTRSANAGETTLQVNTGMANMPVNYVIYEFPNGTAYHSGIDSNNGYWPTLTGLPGDPSITLFSVWGSYCHNAVNPVQSAVWNYGWKEDYDLMTDSNGVTYGIYTTLGYKDRCSDTSGGAVWSYDFYVANNFNVAQMVVFALTMP